MVQLEMPPGIICIALLSTLHQHNGNHGNQGLVGTADFFIGKCQCIQIAEEIHPLHVNMGGSENIDELSMLLRDSWA